MNTKKIFSLVFGQVLDGFLSAGTINEISKVLNIISTTKLIVIPVSLVVEFCFLAIIYSGQIKLPLYTESPEIPPIEFDCKLYDNFTESIELIDKVEKISTLNGVEIKKDSDEWNDIYSTYVVKPLDIALKSYCKFLNNSKKKTGNYSKGDVNDFHRKYTNALKKLNEIMPEVVQKSTDEIKITVKGFTVIHNSKNYTVSVDMNELLTDVMQKWILDPFDMTFMYNDLYQYWFTLLPSDIPKKQLEKIVGQKSLKIPLPK